MAVVPAVLLDHVQQHPADAELGVVAGVVHSVVERGKRRFDASGRFDLGVPAGERLVDARPVDVVEITVEVVGTAVEHRRRVLAGQRAPEPAALDIGQVPRRARAATSSTVARASPGCREAARVRHHAQSHFGTAATRSSGRSRARSDRLDGSRAQPPQLLVRPLAGPRDVWRGSRVRVRSAQSCRRWRDRPRPGMPRVGPHHRSLRRAQPVRQPAKMFAHVDRSRHPRPARAGRRRDRRQQRVGLPDGPGAGRARAQPW